MGATSPPPPDAAKPTAGTTAQHMADALSFLMRVATEAGMGSIAAKLANVRVNLLNYDDAEKRNAVPEQGDSKLNPKQGKRDERRRLC